MMWKMKPRKGCMMCKAMITSSNLKPLLKIILMIFLKLKLQLILKQKLKLKRKPKIVSTSELNMM